MDLTLHHHPVDGSQGGSDILEYSLLFHLPRQEEDFGVKGSHMDIDPSSCLLHSSSVRLIQDKMNLRTGPSLGELKQHLFPHPVTVIDILSSDPDLGQLLDKLDGEVRDVLVFLLLWYATSRDYDGAEMPY